LPSSSCFTDLLGGEQQVIHSRRGDHRGPGEAVVLMQARIHPVPGGGPHPLDITDEFHDVPARCGEPDALALADRLTPADPLDREPVAGDPVFEVGEVVVAFDLERHHVEPDPGGVAQPQ
jgi:hypothetical protein